MTGDITLDHNIFVWRASTLDLNLFRFDILHLFSLEEVSTYG